MLEHKPAVPYGEGMRHTVTRHPRASLGRVLDDVGSTLLDLVLGKPDSVTEIGGVAIHDPHDEAPLPTSAMVLAVDVREASAIADLVTHVADQGAAVLVVRAPVSVDQQVQDAVSRTGVVLLGLTRGASWTQLTTLLRSTLAGEEVGVTGSESLGGIPAGDLFAVANAVSALLDSPVTIEDRNLRVLAFSGRQDEVDQSRVETVLGRQVPERLIRALDEGGMLQELYRSSRPVFLDPMSLDFADVVYPRVAIAVRAGDEILGSMWAAVRQPLTAEREQGFVDCAKLVALHMLRHRAGADVERRLRTDLVATVLEGGPGAREAASRLRLTQRAVVLALAQTTKPGLSAARLEAERERLASAYAMNLSAAHPGSAAALVGGVVYGILPIEHGACDEYHRPLRIAEDFLRRTGSRGAGVIGVGRIAANVAALAQSRRDADRVVRVLRSQGSAKRVSTISDVWCDSLLLQLGDLMAAEEQPLTEPIAGLLAYDSTHGTVLVETLHAWLDAFGDVKAAAAVLNVHPNTFRYRLKRLVEIGELDLSDPQVRFAAMFQLRLMEGQGRRSAAGVHG
ncbi:helix-turn-helix domain-containing protein [Kribbella sancticallisti]|uniref:Helix-turn-helix domain-containing protein n=1 Tax=Kribbella sancticallisti TaxID=460087 RepID=A0ABP4NEG2_9ACTN